MNLNKYRRELMKRESLHVKTTSSFVWNSSGALSLVLFCFSLNPVTGRSKKDTIIFHHTSNNLLILFPKLFHYMFRSEVVDWRRCAVLLPLNVRDSLEVSPNCECAISPNTASLSIRHCSTDGPNACKLEKLFMQKLRKILQWNEQVLTKSTPGILIVEIIPGDGCFRLTT